MPIAAPTITANTAAMSQVNSSPGMSSIAGEWVADATLEESRGVRPPTRKWPPLFETTGSTLGMRPAVRHVVP
jgi:hypothetical protein